jgi:hypothetical protein
LRNFIYQFPWSPYAELARDRLRILEEARREREEQARKKQEREDEERRRAQTCQSERDDLNKIGSDLARLKAFAEQAKCEEARAEANSRIAAIVAQREEERQREEDRRREEEPRQQAARCNSALATVRRLGDLGDLDALREF